MHRTILPLLVLLLIAGCQPVAVPAPPPSVRATLPQPPAWLDELRGRAAALPAARVAATEEGLTIAYPGEALFATAAVLPLPGGAEVLDPLADLLAAYPAARWRAEVRAATVYGADYDRELAAGRAGLLQRYFVNRGAPGDAVAWTSGAGDAPPLTLTLETAQWRAASTSSGVKE